MDVTVNQLYVAILALTAALEANTAALNGNPVSKGEAKPESKQATKPETSEETADENEVTLRDVEAALIDVKNKFGSDVAKAIVKEVGGVTTAKKIPAEKYEEVISACEEQMKQEVKEETAEEETPVEEKTSSYTLEDVKEAAKALGSISNEHLAQAKKIIKDVGGAEKTNEVPKENYEALITALHEALAAANEDDI